MVHPTLIDKIHGFLSTPVGQKAPTTPVVSPPAQPGQSDSGTPTPTNGANSPAGNTGTGPQSSTTVVPVVGGNSSYLARSVGLRALPASKTPVLNATAPQTQSWVFTAPTGYILGRLRLEEDATWTVTAGLGYMSQLHNRIQMFVDGAQAVYMDGASLDKALIVLGGIRNHAYAAGHPLYVDDAITTTATQYFGYWEPHLPLRGRSFKVEIDFVAASTLAATTTPISAGQLNVAVTPIWEPDHGGPTFTFLAQTFNGVPKLNASGLVCYSLGYTTTVAADDLSTIVTQWTFAGRSYNASQIIQLEELTNDLENGQTTPTGAMTGLSNETPSDPTVASSYFANVIDIADSLGNLSVVFDGDETVTLIAFGQTTPQSMATAGA